MGIVFTPLPPKDSDQTQKLPPRNSSLFILGIPPYLQSQGTDIQADLSNKFLLVLPLTVFKYT